MKFSDISLKHLPIFNFDTSKSIAFISPHYIFNIEDSIHYKALLNGDFSVYKNMAENQPEHSISNFKKLIGEFDINKMQTIKVKFNQSINKYLVDDGCHRLSIIKYKKIFLDEIPDIYIEKK